MSDIAIREIEEMSLRGSYVLDGFPSVGLVGSIVANYLVGYLKLKQVAVVDSDQFPTVSLIKGGMPFSPVRIYAGPIRQGKDEKMVVFTSEFQPPPHLIKPLACTMMDWVEDHKCRLLISPEGLKSAPLRKEEGKPNEEPPPNQLFGVGSTDEMMELLKANNVRIFEGGVIVGLAGVLLNEGLIRGFNVITLLASARADLPDARAAANVSEVIGNMILKSKLDIKPLLEEAKSIEAGLNDVYKKAGKEDELKKIREVMYG